VRAASGAHSGRRWTVAALALGVGLIFSWPHWWWQATAPDYAIVRGYALSDDDLALYSVALNDSSDGQPPLAAYQRSFETRDQLHYAVLSNWLTNWVLGNAVRLAGSLELFVPIGLLASGAATFALLYGLARRFVPSYWLAVCIALFACFRYPFYVSALAAGRRLIAGGLPPDWPALLRVSFPGMVNGYQLYPHVRWPVPGMMLWWFLLALLFTLDWLAEGRNAWAGRWLALRVAALGLWVGLAAYVYFFFWSYLMAFLAVLALACAVGQRRRLAAGLAAALVVAALVSAPFWLLASGL
jgi:hypothetical protein